MIAEAARSARHVLKVNALLELLSEVCKELLKAEGLTLKLFDL